MKLAAYSKDGGTPKVGHVEDGEISSLGGPGMLEYNEHEWNTDRRYTAVCNVVDPIITARGLLQDLRKLLYAHGVRRLISLQPPLSL